MDQGVVVSELAVGVRGDDLIKLGDDELVFHTRDSVATGVELGQELASLQELEARQADGIDEPSRYRKKVEEG